MLIPGNRQSPRPQIIREVCGVVQDNFYNKRKLFGWRSKCARNESRAESAKTHQDIIDLIDNLLKSVGVSHLRLIEPDVYSFDIDSEMNDIKRPSFGFDLFDDDGRIFVRDVIDGGAAYDVGIARGDTVLKINGEEASDSRLLRPSGTGAGFHIYPEGPTKLLIARGRSITEKVMTPKNWNHIDAIARSAHLENLDGMSVGYIHLWHMSNEKVLSILKDLMFNGFKDAQGLILDLRGFGGNIEFPNRVAEMMREWKKPAVAIIDSETRSSKEMLAFMLRRDKTAILVGERTKGSVLGSIFFPLSDGSKLIVPTVDCSSYTDGVSLEKNGVKPDVKVADALGIKDPILETAAQVLRSMVG